MFKMNRMCVSIISFSFCRISVAGVCVFSLSRFVRSLIRQLSAFSTSLLIVVVVVPAANFFVQCYCDVLCSLFSLSFFNFAFIFFCHWCMCVFACSYDIYEFNSIIYRELISYFLLSFCWFFHRHKALRVSVCLHLPLYIESEMKYINQFLCVWTLCVCVPFFLFLFLFAFLRFGCHIRMQFCHNPILVCVNVFIYFFIECDMCVCLCVCSSVCLSVCLPAWIWMVYVMWNVVFNAVK